MFRFNFADKQISGLIDGLGWDFQQIGIVPEPLSFNEINAVLVEVGLALGFVKLKYDIESIPFLNPRRRSNAATNAQAQPPTARVAG